MAQLTNDEKIRIMQIADSQTLAHAGEDLFESRYKTMVDLIIDYRSKSDDQEREDK